MHFDKTARSQIDPLDEFSTKNQSISFDFQQFPYFQNDMFGSLEFAINKM